MDYSTIFIFIILILLSGFFSGTEIAFMSIPKHKVNYFVKQKFFGAKNLEYIKKYSDRILILILIGNNLVNTYIAAFATTIAIQFSKNGGLGINESTAVGIATGIITFLLLLFGEIVPKSFAIKNAEKISLIIAGFYRVLIFLFYPLIIIIEYITLFFSGKQKVNKISEEEIEAFIDMGKEFGTLENKKHEYLKKILDFHDKTAEDIMTPRVKIEKISSNYTVKQAKEYIINHTHSRIPVYKGDIDNIVGIVNIRLLLSQIDKGNENKILENIELINPIKVPLNKSIDGLLKIFQKIHQHIAIVIDEYGGVAGLVTFEDVIEEIFGQIQDETDNEDLMIKQISDTEYIIDSTITFENMLDLFSISIDELNPQYKEYIDEKVSYFITDYLERFPYSKENITVYLYENKKLDIKVLEVKNQTIGKIKIKKLEKK